MPEQTTKRPRGRQTKLTPELTEELAGYIAKGLSNKDACERVHISEDTFYRWLNRGEKATKDTDLCVFYESIQKARIDFKRTHLENIERAAIEQSEKVVEIIRQTPSGDRYIERKTETVSGQWQASAWLLERTDPDQFGRRQRIEHDGKIEGDGASELRVVFVDTEKGEGEDGDEDETD